MHARHTPQAAAKGVQRTLTPARSQDLELRAKETSKAAAPPPSSPLELPKKVSYEGVRDLQKLHAMCSAEVCQCALETFD